MKIEKTTFIVSLLITVICSVAFGMAFQNYNTMPLPELICNECEECEGYDECGVCKEKICIHKRYKQIKDTMKSKAGDIFEYDDYCRFGTNNAYGMYWKEAIFATLSCSVDECNNYYTGYTRDEILNKEFFKPIIE